MIHRLGLFLSLVILEGFFSSSPVVAGTADVNKPDISLQIATEDNQKVIRATVTIDGKPLENATIDFFVKRTFGNLSIGHDQTLDDGTAAVPFPYDLPGGTTGKIQVFTVITNPQQYGAAHAEATFDGSRVIPLQKEEFPRALWSPRAPLVLILTIMFLVTAVWSTYVYVVVQLVKIRKGGIS